METSVLSTRLPPETLPLLARQAARKRLSTTELSAIYLTEKILEQEYPSIGFRDGAAGREAYVLGRRVAVWQVEAVFRETRNLANTATFFRWTESLVKCVLAFAHDFPKDIAARLAAEHKRRPINPLLDPALLMLCRGSTRGLESRISEGLTPEEIAINDS